MCDTAEWLCASSELKWWTQTSLNSNYNSPVTVVVWKRGVEGWGGVDAQSRSLTTEGRLGVKCGCLQHKEAYVAITPRPSHLSSCTKIDTKISGMKTNKYYCIHANGVSDQRKLGFFFWFFPGIHFFFFSHTDVSTWASLSSQESDKKSLSAVRGTRSC